MTFPLPRQSKIPNPDYDQHRDYPSTANVTKHTFPTPHKVLQPEISHTSHMMWIYIYVTSQLPTLQDTPSTTHKVLHRYDHSTVNTTRDIHHLTFHFELHRNEHFTTYTNRNLPHIKPNRSYTETTIQQPILPPKKCTLQLKRIYTEMTSPLPKQPNTYHTPLINHSPLGAT